ncbi:MAG: phage holin family protein [Clostridium sp.]|nr:phage holin family protein [Clostridium sp.]MCM1443755.1 phage holin family protein [Candidatus Amulumruptor caecigallinarius]
MNKRRALIVLKWFIQMIGFTLILMTLAVIFKDKIYIDNSYYGIWCLLASIIIYLLNKTVKPILFRLTLPITALTLGLFYPFINVIILFIVTFILGSHFKIMGGILSFLLIAVLISIGKLIINEIIKWIFRKEN